MRIVAPIIILIIMTVFAGCIESLEESSTGPKSHVDDAHIWQDGWVSDSTMCRESVVLDAGDAYTCSFTFNSDDWVVIDLDVNTDFDPVDLITMSDINYQKYQDGEEYYYLEDWTDFGTFGGQYGKDVEFPEGDWVVLVLNPI
jgi:hypothetical protein